jgi:murein DD-endopeptidase MepM/ murein hydrolase activator NlpD
MIKRFYMLVTFCCLGYAVNSQTQFIWPLRKMPGYSEIPDYYDVNNYVDLNAAAGSTTDWNCQARTYDGHRGIDIDLWPFWWNMMDKNYVAVVAAAPGTVVAVTDNLNNENNCGSPPFANPNWNYIAIQHADNSTSLYGHIRTNSAQVTVGQTVAAGDIIAYVGSSGSSSNPHLHFEVNNLPVTNSQAAGVVEPYAGGCNSIVSRWIAQKPYREPAVLRVMTHGSRPRLTEFDGNNDFCRTGEAINAKASFAPNDSIYFGIATRDFLNGQSYSVTVLDPNGQTWFSSNATANTDFTRNYNTIDSKLPGNSVSGTYTVMVTLNGTTTMHFFSVNCPSDQNVNGTILGWRGFKSSGTISSTAEVPPGNRLLLQAAARITLSPGFSASEGSTMKARIKDCNYSE